MKEHFCQLMAYILSHFLSLKQEGRVYTILLDDKPQTKITMTIERRE